MHLTEKSVNIIVGLTVISIFYLGIRSFDGAKYRDLLAQAQAFFSSISTNLTQLKALPPSPTPSSSPKPTPYVYREPTLEQKQYLLALGAILSQQNSENFTVLRSNLTRASLRPLLVEWWNISDRNSAIEVLDWLRDEGHSSELDFLIRMIEQDKIILDDQWEQYKINQGFKKENYFILDFAWAHRIDLKDKSLHAWDYGRLVNVARWCYTLGYINEQEAWTYIVPAASKLQREYDSWQDYGDHYILGRGYWLRDLGGTKQQEAILKYLLNPLTKTPWTTLDWRTNLD